MDFQLKTLTVAQAAAEKSDVLIVLAGSAPIVSKDPLSVLAASARNVGYPAMALILRRDGSATLRDDLHPAQWSGPQSEFTVDLTR